MALSSRGPVRIDAQPDKRFRETKNGGKVRERAKRA